MWKWCASLALTCLVAACATTRPSPQATFTLEQQTNTTLGEMQSRDPDLRGLLVSSAGYAVFPNIGAAGALVAGGAFGKGILYEHGVPTGYVEVRQGSIGPQLGGQTYAELLVLRDQTDIDRLKAGTFDLGANASAVLLKAGAAAEARFATGTTVFVEPRGGMMAAASISGQQIQFRPLSG